MCTHLTMYSRLQYLFSMTNRMFLSVKVLLHCYITVILLFCCQSMADLPVTDTQGPREYCIFESFEPKCGSNEVVVLTEALYGRMQLGRCVNRDYGFLGCQKDVLPVLEPLCSGRSKCRVNISPQMNDNLLDSPCPADLTVYLLASYGCLSVMSSTSICSSSPMDVGGKNGYLSSSLSVEKGYGSIRCPWRIPLTKGQEVNITLYNFIFPSSPASLLHPHACYSVLTVKQTSNIQNVRLCTHDPREKHVIISYDNDVELTFAEQPPLNNVGHFVVYFEVRGCEAPSVPENAELTRNGNTAVIKCNFTETSWTIECSANYQWSEEPSMSCPPKPKEWSFLDIFEDLKTINPYILMGVVAGGVALGVLIGGFSLFLAIRAFKRRHPLPPSAKKLRRLREEEYRQMYALQQMKYLDRDDRRPSQEGRLTPSTTGRRYHTCGRHPPPIQPRPNAPVPTRPEHIYEIPNYEIQEEDTNTSTLGSTPGTSRA